MKDITDSMGRAIADMRDGVRADAVRVVSPAERMDLLRVAGELQRQADALVVEAVASAEAEFCRSFGCVSMNEVLQRVLRTDAAGAGRVVRAAKVVHRGT